MGAEGQAAVSGRPGAFLLAGDPVSSIDAAFQKAATPPPTQPPTQPPVKPASSPAPKK